MKSKIFFDHLFHSRFSYSTSGGNYASPFFASFLPTPGYLEVFSTPPILPSAGNLGANGSELPISFSATITAVPEPSSILSLLACGTLAASALKRHSSSKIIEDSKVNFS